MLTSVTQFIKWQIACKPLKAEQFSPAKNKIVQKVWGLHIQLLQSHLCRRSLNKVPSSLHLTYIESEIGGQQFKNQKSNDRALMLRKT